MKHSMAIFVFFISFFAVAQFSNVDNEFIKEIIRKELNEKRTFPNPIQLEEIDHYKHKALLEMNDIVIPFTFEKTPTFEGYNTSTTYHYHLFAKKITHLFKHPCFNPLFNDPQDFHLDISISAPSYLYNLYPFISISISYDKDKHDKTFNCPPLYRIEANLKASQNL